MPPTKAQRGFAVKFFVKGFELVEHEHKDEKGEKHRIICRLRLQALPSPAFPSPIPPQTLELHVLHSQLLQPGSILSGELSLESAPTQLDAGVEAKRIEYKRQHAQFLEKLARLKADQDVRRQIIKRHAGVVQKSGVASLKADARADYEAAAAELLSVDIEMDKLRVNRARVKRELAILSGGNEETDDELEKEAAPA